jgi:hypothetical protein
VYSGFFFSGSRSSHFASDGSAAASATTPAPLLGRPRARGPGAAAAPFGRPEGRAGGIRATRARSELERAMAMDDCCCCSFLPAPPLPYPSIWAVSYGPNHPSTVQASEWAGP